MTIFAQVPEDPDWANANSRTSGVSDQKWKEAIPRFVVILINIRYNEMIMFLDEKDILFSEMK